MTLVEFFSGALLKNLNTLIKLHHLPWSAGFSLCMSCMGLQKFLLRSNTIQGLAGAGVPDGITIRARKRSENSALRLMVQLRSLYDRGLGEGFASLFSYVIRPLQHRSTGDFQDSVKRYNTCIAPANRNPHSLQVIKSWSVQRSWEWQSMTTWRIKNHLPYEYYVATGSNVSVWVQWEYHSPSDLNSEQWLDKYKTI